MNKLLPKFLIVALIAISVFLIIIFLGFVYQVHLLRPCWIKEGSYAVYASNSTLSILINATGEGYEFLKSEKYILVKGKLCIRFDVIKINGNEALVKVNITIFNISSIICGENVTCPKGNYLTSSKTLNINLDTLMFSGTKIRYGFFNLMINPKILSTTKTHITKIIVYHGPCPGLIGKGCIAVSTMYLVDMNAWINIFKGERIYKSLIFEYGHSLNSEYFGVNGAFVSLGYGKNGLLKWILLSKPIAWYASDVLYEVMGINYVKCRGHTTLIFLVESNV